MPLKDKQKYNAYMKAYRRQIKEDKDGLPNHTSVGNPEGTLTKHKVIVHRNKVIKRKIPNDNSSDNHNLKPVMVTLLDGRVLYFPRR